MIKSYDFPPKCADTQCKQEHYFLIRRQPTKYHDAVAAKVERVALYHPDVFYLSVTPLEHQAYRIRIIFISSLYFSSVDDMREENRKKGIKNDIGEVAGVFKVLSQQRKKKEVLDLDVLCEEIVLDHRANQLLHKRLNFNILLNQFLQSQGLLPPLISIILEYYGGPLEHLYQELWKRHVDPRVNPVKDQMPEWPLLSILKKALE